MITGGGRGFCAGQDLNDRLVKPGEKLPPSTSLERYYNPLVRKLRALPFPVIAAVNGVAAGAGCNIALACDIVIAARSASFVQSFARIGLVPDSGGTWFLPRLVGDARARGLALLAEPLPAEKAESWGLIWKCVDDALLAAEALKNVRALCRGADAGAGADQARAQCLGRQHARRSARSGARPAKRGPRDAGLRRGRARLHGKAQTQILRPPMSRAQVRALRSIDLGFSDLDKALRFFTEVWKLTPAGESGGVHYLRATCAFHHILTLRHMAQPALLRMVFDAADADTVDALHGQVVAHGLKTIDPPGRLRQPHGDYGFGFKDPEGRNIAVVCGVRDHADAADRPDRPRKLSHINVNAGDSEATFACYRDALGFRLTDTTQRLRFLSCNADHHSVVLGFTGGDTLNHIAFEMPDLELVMRGAGRMRDDGRAIEWGPGRHGPGNNVFCYFLGPRGHAGGTDRRDAADRRHASCQDAGAVDVAARPARSLGHQRRPERTHGGRRIAL